MRTLYFGSNQYQFPDKWEELNKEQYLMLIDALTDYQSGKANAPGARASWFCRMAGIDIKRRDNENDVFWENIYRAADLFDFFFQIEYLDPETLKPKSLKLIPRDLREQLMKRPPIDLPDIPEFRWASKLKYRYTIDAVFAKNLLPEIQLNGRAYPGYRFDLNGSLLTTSLTASQFIEANIAFNEYVKDPRPEHLDLLVQSLYFSDLVPTKKKGLWLHKKQDQHYNLINDIPARVKFAILLNFQAILAFLMNKTRYAMIWNRKPAGNQKNEDKKLSIGMADSMYMLAKSGYGSVDEMRKENLITYLDLLLKNIIDTVTFLHDQKINVNDISVQTGLSIAQIQKVINI